MIKHCLIPLFFAPYLLIAQKYIDTHDPNDIKSLLGKGNDITGYGGADLKLGDIKGSRTLMVGAQGGVIVNRNYTFGLAGYGIATKNEFEGVFPGDTVRSRLNLYGGYGGLVIGAILWTRELVHIHIPVLMGAGAFDVVDEDFFSSSSIDTEFTIERSAFFVVEPGIQLEFNITENFRLAAGASYRHIQGTDLDNVSDSEVSGWNTLVSLKFGRF